MKYKDGGAINQHKKMAMGMSIDGGSSGGSVSKSGKVSKMSSGGSVSPKGYGCATKKQPCKIC
jgi:hypothetical protein